MADTVNPKRAAIALGTFMALVHLIWAIVVAIGVAQWFVDWIMGLHFIGITITILPFNLLAAIALVVVSFVCGAVLGYLLAYFWNWAKKFK